MRIRVLLVSFRVGSHKRFARSKDFEEWICGYNRVRIFWVV